VKSSDQTLLQRIGFQDPDKMTTRHDLAIQYLSQSETAWKLARKFMAFKERDWSKRSSSYSGKADMEDRYTLGTAIKCFPEAALTKGEGQYKTLVGFIDLVIRYETIWQCRGIDGNPIPRDYSSESTDFKKLFVEVKVTERSISDAIRQINLYRQFLDGSPFVLVTDYQINEAERQMLDQVLIAHAVLGPQFSEYVNAQADKPPKKVESEEI